MAARGEGEAAVFLSRYYRSPPTPWLGCCDVHA